MSKSKDDFAVAQKSQQVSFKMKIKETKMMFNNYIQDLEIEIHNEVI